MVDIIESKGNYYRIDSQYTVDDSFEVACAGYKIIVSSCDANGNIFCELYTEWHANQETMEMRHKFICGHLKTL